MAQKFNPAAWTSGTIPAVADFQNIAADLATRGIAIDGGGYGRANSAYLTLMPKDLPGTAYTVTAASWSTGVATLTIGAHNLIVNQHVKVASITPSGYNATDVVITAVTGTTISYAVASNPGAWSSGGTVTADLITTPGNGTIAIDSHNAVWVYYSGAWQRLSPLVVADPTVNTVANTTSPLTLNQFQPTPYSFRVGELIRIKASGVYSTANGSDTVRITVGVDGLFDAFFFTSPAGVVTNAPWSFEWNSIIAAGLPSGLVECSLLAGFTSLAPQAATARFSLDTTPRIWKAYATWSNALSGNTISVRQFSVEMFN